MTIQGTFIVVLAYFLGKAWATFLPRGDRYEARWREKGGQGKPPLWIRIVSFVNPRHWTLKEHAVCSITATSASNAIISIEVFSAQLLFYNLPLSAATIILSIISIGLFGYGLAGILRPIAVWHVDSVYWTTLPVVKTIQGLHWQEVKNSKPLRYFWYAFTGMFIYEFFPAYIFPFLNSFSIPCLASMNATGDTAAILTNLFGGASNNEGLGLFSLSFDWQYVSPFFFWVLRPELTGSISIQITSLATTMPLSLQVNLAVGFFVCYLAMLGIYYNNVWGSRSLPFMSTTLRSADGSSYPITKVFDGGVLNEGSLAKYGIPRLSGSFAYAMFMANAAVSTSSQTYWKITDNFY